MQHETNPYSLLLPDPTLPPPIHTPTFHNLDDITPIQPSEWAHVPSEPSRVKSLPQIRNSIAAVLIVLLLQLRHTARPRGTNNFLHSLGGWAEQCQGSV